MKVEFKKRRFYKGKLREIGDKVDMDYKHARAFLRVNAVVPAATQAPPKKPPKMVRKPNPVQVPEEKPEETKNDAEIINAGTQLQLDFDSQITVVDEYEPGENEDDDEDGQGDEESYPAELSYRELQDRCKQRGLSAKGSAVELAARLEEGE